MASVKGVLMGIIKYVIHCILAYFEKIGTNNSKVITY